jgi:hypothetical protein
MLESKYQAEVIKKLRKLFPGCIILKNDSSYMQGVPDLTILYGRFWAMLEVKTSENAPHQPNQDWYVTELGKMSFTAFIFPENEREVLRELQQALQPRRASRLPIA